jgi:hypothetical protein
LILGFGVFDLKDHFAVILAAFWTHTMGGFISPAVVAFYQMGKRQGIMGATISAPTPRMFTLG